MTDKTTERLKETAASAIRERDQLKAENAKLRELVSHMYECMCNVDADGNHECYSCEYEDGGCDFERLMRDLGVGVDA